MKKIFRLVFNEFIYGGHLQSLGAASIVFVSCKKYLEMSADNVTKKWLSGRKYARTFYRD